MSGGMSYREWTERDTKYYWDYCLRCWDVRTDFREVQVLTQASRSTKSNGGFKLRMNTDTSGRWQMLNFSEMCCYIVHSVARQEKQLKQNKLNLPAEDSSSTAHTNSRMIRAIFQQICPQH